VTHFIEAEAENKINIDFSLQHDSNAAIYLHCTDGLFAHVKKKKQRDTQLKKRRAL
jgi:hypothetical protein